jgi:hypothetical protein
MSCEPGTSRCCKTSDLKSCETLVEMVAAYQEEYAKAEIEEQEWWGDQTLSYRERCRRALFAFGDANKRDSHQWVYSLAFLQERAERLFTRLAEPEDDTSFEDLYQRVELALEVPPNRKPLLIYDVTKRIGTRSKTKPENVYLHAGAKIGAQNLGVTLKANKRFYPLVDFPLSIRKLTPAQAEDFLCLAKDHLALALRD